MANTIYCGNRSFERKVAVYRRIVRNMCFHYRLLQDRCRIQNMPNAEDTDRYNTQIKWYQLIRVVITRWMKETPNDAAAVRAAFCFDSSVKPSDIQIAERFHMSTSTLSHVKAAFIDELMVEAARINLL